MGDLKQARLSCKWCPSSDAMAEYTDGFKCFSCGGHSGTYKPKTDLEKRELPGIQEDQAFYELPPEARAFLYKFHFTDEMIDWYDIRWATDFMIWSTKKQQYVNTGDRIVFTGERLADGVFYEARTLDPGNKLKWVSIGGKSDLYYSHTIHTEGETVVIVEDVISAMRVGELIPAVALRGTNLTASNLVQLQSHYKKFIVWLDSDAPGQKAARKIFNKLQWFTDKVQVVLSEKDPKCYSDDKIRLFLESAM